MLRSGTLLKWVVLNVCNCAHGNRNKIVRQQIEEGRHVVCSWCFWPFNEFQAERNPLPYLRGIATSKMRLCRQWISMSDGSESPGFRTRPQSKQVCRCGCIWLGLTLIRPPEAAGKVSSSDLLCGCCLNPATFRKLKLLRHNLRIQAPLGDMLGYLRAGDDGPENG